MAALSNMDFGSKASNPAEFTIDPEKLRSVLPPSEKKPEKEYDTSREITV